MEGINHNCGLCVTHKLHDAHSFIKSLQHRGREACGIAAIGEKIDVMKWIGGVGNVDLEDLHDIFPAEQYHTYMAHVRYATKGREDKILEDAHPHVIGGRIISNSNHLIIRNCDVAIVHNGQADLEHIVGLKAREVCDTKLLLDYFWQNGAHQLIKNIPGAYTLAIADKDQVMIMRDKFGIKPGCLGLKDGKYCATSESVALIENGATFIEDLEPGTIYYLSPQGRFRKEKVFSEKTKHCFFEWNYISRVESIIDEVQVMKVRTELGKALAEEFHPKDIDIITYLPRCPKVSARSYAKAMNQEASFMKVFYKLKGERAFQGTNKSDRNNSIRKNLHLHTRMEEILTDKIIIVIDDSTIRGTNSSHAKSLLDRCNVKKIYYVNYTPKIGIIGEDGTKHGCMFGVDMPPEDDFIVRNRLGKNKTDEELTKENGMQMYFLSPEGMFKAFERAGMSRKNLCSYCIGGEYPLK